MARKKSDDIRIKNMVQELADYLSKDISNVSNILVGLKDSLIKVKFVPMSPEKQKTNEFNKQQLVSVKVVLIDTLYGLVQFVADFIDINLPPIDVDIEDTDKETLEDAKKIIQRSLNDLIPDYNQVGIGFIPVKLENSPITKFSELQQTAIAEYTKSVFLAILDVITFLMSLPLEDDSSSLKPPPKSPKYLN